MGKCLSTQTEQRGAANTEHRLPPHDTHSDESQPSNVPRRVQQIPVAHSGSAAAQPLGTYVENWSTNDLITYLCTLENAKFCASEYDLFKASLQSLAVNGNSVHALCYDTQLLRDLGLKEQGDIELIQTAFISLSEQQQIARSAQHTNNKQSDDEKLSVAAADDDFFPSQWKFPVMDGEKIKNSHYVGQRLLITDKMLHPTPSVCVYVDANWIVIKYLQVQQSDPPAPVSSHTNANSNLSVENAPPAAALELSTSVSTLPSLSPPTATAENVYKNMEKLHVIRNAVRIEKLNSGQSSKNGSQEHLNNNNPAQYDSLFTDDAGYAQTVGMSFANSSQSVMDGMPPVPACYVDPISCEIMQEPVTSKVSGRTYEKSIILDYLKDQQNDPFSLQPMTKHDLFLNMPLKRAIQTWLENNPQTATLY